MFFIELFDFLVLYSMELSTISREVGTLYRKLCTLYRISSALYSLQYTLQSFLTLFQLQCFWSSVFLCVRDVFLRKSHKLSITLVNFVEASSHGHNFAWILLRHVTGLEGSFSKIFTVFKKVSRFKKVLPQQKQDQEIHFCILVFEFGSFSILFFVVGVQVLCVREKNQLLSEGKRSRLFYGNKYFDSKLRWGYTILLRRGNTTLFYVRNLIVTANPIFFTNCNVFYESYVFFF